jgi:hypothetical protein
MIAVFVLSLAVLGLGASMPLTTPASAHSSAGASILPEPSAFAGGHDQLCLDNYKQCMKGCDGMESCSKQCKVNYDKCMQ